VKPEQLDAAASVGMKTSVAGATVAGGAWAFSLNEVVAVLGLLAAVCGFFVSWYYKHKQNQRLQAIHDLRVARLQRGGSDHAELDETPMDD
jgi:hypothetical protein